MNNNFKIAKEAVELFGENAFYSITINTYGVTLQGKFNPSIIQRCKQDDYLLAFDDNGYVNITKENITITLTQ